MSNVPQTPNFKLYKPPFDRKAWHQYANKNFEVIDAVLTTYLDVGNIVGVWENSTSYSMGDRAIDPDVGQVFEAAVNHTSDPSPSTFAEARTANPTYWTSLSVSARGLGAWAPGTLYQPNDFVVSGSIYAVCLATHTSTGVFANDAVYWDYLLDASSLPTVPSVTGHALELLRVDAGETGTEWASLANVIAWLGLGSAAFFATSTFASASHPHNVADLADASADARSMLQQANNAAIFAAIKQAGSTSATGVLELADQSEMDALTDTARVPSVSVLATHTGKGTQQEWFGAAEWIPTITSGAARSVRELATNDLMLETLLFPDASSKYATLFWRPKKRYNNGTVTLTVYWTGQSGSGTVIWNFTAVAVSDDDAMDAAPGGSQSTPSDTFLVANDEHITSPTSAMTFSGSPATADGIFIKITRDHASDTFTGTAELIGVLITYTASAGNDA